MEYGWFLRLYRVSGENKNKDIQLQRSPFISSILWESHRALDSASS